MKNRVHTSLLRVYCEKRRVLARDSRVSGTRFPKLNWSFLDELTSSLSTPVSLSMEGTGTHVKWKISCFSKHLKVLRP